MKVHDSKKETGSRFAAAHCPSLYLRLELIHEIPQASDRLTVGKTCTSAILSKDGLDRCHVGLEPVSAANELVPSFHELTVAGEFQIIKNSWDLYPLLRFQCGAVQDTHAVRTFRTAEYLPLPLVNRFNEFIGTFVIFAFQLMTRPPTLKVEQLEVCPTETIRSGVTIPDN